MDDEFDDIYAGLGGGDGGDLLGSTSFGGSIGGLPPDVSTDLDGRTVTYSDGSSEFYGADGSYYYNDASGAQYYTDDSGTYYSDESGNWYDGDGHVVTNQSLLSKLGNAAKDALKNGSGGSGGKGNTGKGGIGGPANATTSAAQVAANNRLEQERLALEQEGLNLRGTNDFESQLMARAREEQALKDATFRDINSTETLQNKQNRVLNPRVSPFDPTGGPKYSDDYKSQLAGDVSMAEKTLHTPNRYSASSWPEMTPFTPIDLTKVQEATGTQPGTLEKIGAGVGLAYPWLDLLDTFLTGGGKNRPLNT